MRTVRKFSDEQRNNYLRLWQESGLIQRAFCEEQRLILRTFNNWKNSRVPKDQPVKDSGPAGFIPLCPSGAKPEEKTGVQICIGRYQITVEGSFDEVVLNQVLTILEARDVH